MVFSPPLFGAVDAGAMTLDIHFWAGPVGSLSKNQRLKIDDNGEGKTKVSWIAKELRFDGCFFWMKKAPQEINSSPYVVNRNVWEWFVVIPIFKWLVRPRKLTYDGWKTIFLLKWLLFT